MINPHGHVMFVRKIGAVLNGDVIHFPKYLRDDLHIDNVVLEVQDGLKELNKTSGVEWDIPRYFKSSLSPTYLMHTLDGSDCRTEAKKFSRRIKVYNTQKNYAGAIVRVHSTFDARPSAVPDLYLAALRSYIPAMEIGVMAPGDLHGSETLKAMVKVAAFGFPQISVKSGDDPVKVLINNIAQWQAVNPKLPLYPTLYIYNNDVYNQKGKDLQAIWSACVGATDINGVGFWEYDPNDGKGLDANVNMRQFVMLLDWVDNNPTTDPSTPATPTTPTTPTTPAGDKYYLACDLAYSDDGDIDYGALVRAGVKLFIVKIGQRNYVDPLFTKHIQNALANGGQVAGYWLTDPTYEYKKQVDILCKAIDPYLSQVKFVANDMELHEKYLWVQKNKKKGYWKVSEVSGDIISDVNWNINNLLHAMIGNVITYTRTSFVNDYAKKSLTWLYKWPVWLAAYPSTRVITSDKVTAVQKAYTYCATWEEYLNKWAPKPMAITLPAGVKEWSIWQFSGDRVMLPGCGGYMDLNWVRDNGWI